MLGEDDLPRYFGLVVGGEVTFLTVLRVFSRVPTRQCGAGDPSCLLTLPGTRQKGECSCMLTFETVFFRTWSVSKFMYNRCSGDLIKLPFVPNTVARFAGVFKLPHRFVKALLIAFP